MKKSVRPTSQRIKIVLFQSLLIIMVFNFGSAVNRCTTYADPRLAQSFTKHKDNFKRLDSYSTAMQVLSGEDLSGRVAVITGSNSGIGVQY